MKANVCKVMNIKSNYILKNLFQMLIKRRYLDLINYNKALQNSLKIDINDYKNTGKKIKIGKRNGFGKVYKLDKKILLFEGEYLNGRKNGKGKEYFSNSKIKFEGEYLNGIKWNGKGYNKNGIINFEIKNGNGKKEKEMVKEKIL